MVMGIQRWAIHGAMVSSVPLKNGAWTGFRPQTHRSSPPVVPIAFTPLIARRLHRDPRCMHYELPKTASVITGYLIGANLVMLGISMAYTCTGIRGFFLLLV